MDENILKVLVELFLYQINKTELMTESAIQDPTSKHIKEVRNLIKGFEHEYYILKDGGKEA